MFTQRLSQTHWQVGVWCVAVAVVVVFSLRQGAAHSPSPRAQDAAPRTQDSFTVRPKLSLEHKREVHAVAFSPVDNTVATGSADGIVRLWDADSPATEPTMLKEQDRNATSQVNAIAFSPEGARLASAHADGFVRLWNIQTRAPLKLQRHHEPVTSVAFSARGNIVASGSLDKTVVLWNANTGALKIQKDFKKEVHAVAFHPTNDVLAVGCQDGTVRLWNIPANHVHELRREQEWVTSVAYSPDGSTLASGSQDGTVVLWNVEKDKKIRQMKDTRSPGSVKSVAFSPDGSILASGSADGKVRLWDVETGGEPKWSQGGQQGGHLFPVWSVAFSRDGKTLVSGSSDADPHRTAQLWEVDQWASPPSPVPELAQTIPAQVSQALAFSRDRWMMASGNDDGVVRLWDLRAGELKLTLKGHSGKVRAVAFSDDGKSVTSCDGDMLIVWDAQNGVKKRTQDKISADSAVTAVALSPDGKWLATASEDSKVRLWDAQGEAKPTTLGEHKSPVYTLVFSPNGDMLASGGGDYTVRLWEVKEGKGKSPQTLTADSVVSAVAFSPDGRTIASGSKNGEITLWDARQRNPKIWTLPGHTDAVTAMAFLPRGKTSSLASGSSDGTIRLWDVQKKEPKPLIAKPIRPVTAIAFSPDGKQMASGCGDGTLKLWDAQNDTLLVTLFSFPPAAGRTVETGLSDEYLIITPQGYYTSSLRADRDVYFWLDDRWFPVECFKNPCWKPDKVKQVLAGSKTASVSSLHLRPPFIKSVSPDSGYTVTGDRVAVTLTVLDDKDDHNMEWKFYINDDRAESIPLEKQSSQPVKGRKTTEYRLIYTTTILIRSHLPTIKLEVAAKDDDELWSQGFNVKCHRSNFVPTMGKGRLLGLCVGVSLYKDSDFPSLSFAHNDATELAKELDKQGGIYSEARVKSLTNEQATRRNVKGELDDLIRNTKDKRDTVVLLLSGHGWKDVDGRFYFITHDADYDDIANTALPWEALVKQLGELSARSKRVIVFLDACHSGSTATNSELDKASDDADVMVFASSRGVEESQEKTEWQHGAFTKALLEVLRGESPVTIPYLLDYVGKRVSELTNGKQNPDIVKIRHFSTTEPIFMQR